MNIALAEWTPLAGWMLGYCCLELHVYLLQHLKKVQHFPQPQSACLTLLNNNVCVSTAKILHTPKYIQMGWGGGTYYFYVNHDSETD